MSRRVFWGSSLLVVGLLLLASNLGYLARFSVWSLWPVLVMWPALRLATLGSFVTVVDERRRERIWVGGSLGFRLVMLWVFAGATAQLGHNLSLWPYDWGFVTYWSLPFLLVGVGLAVLLRPRHRAWSWVRCDHCRGEGGNVSGFVGDIRYGDRPWDFKSPMKVSLWAGDVDLDLTTARFSPGPNYLVVRAWAADVDIRVPEGIEVVAEAGCSAGEVSLFDRRRSGLGVWLRAGRPGPDGEAGAGRNDPGAGAQTKLYVKASLTFGQVRVR